MKRRESPKLAAALGAAALLLACGGEEFSSDTDGSAGSAASAGSGGRGGAMGTSGGGNGSGGDTSQGGNTSKGGSSGGSSCDCDADQYCRNGNCRNCSDYSMLDFDAPEALAALGSSGAPRPSFPRSGGGDALFYSSDHPQGHLYFTADFSADGGQQVSGPSAPPEFGPLYIEDQGVLDFNFLFTRASPDGTTGSDIMMASWDDSAHTLSGIMPVPSPINGDATSEYEVAFAAGTTRFWWMSDRSGPPALYTALFNDPGPEQTVALQIPGPAGSTCSALHPNLTPWVTSDGMLMLFSADVVDGQCTPDGTTGLYAVPLSSGGVPVTPSASALNDLDMAGNETTPSLSADRCWIYFASDDGSNSQTFTIYRARRR